jgi:hypothetical protein
LLRQQNAKRYRHDSGACANGWKSGHILAPQCQLYAATFPTDFFHDAVSRDAISETLEQSLRDALVAVCDPHLALLFRVFARTSTISERYCADALSIGSMKTLYESACQTTCIAALSPARRILQELSEGPVRFLFLEEAHHRIELFEEILHAAETATARPPALPLD